MRRRGRHSLQHLLEMLQQLVVDEALCSLVERTVNGNYVTLVLLAML
jgi:hypothetical protein